MATMFRANRQERAQKCQLVGCARKARWAWDAGSSGMILLCRIHGCFATGQEQSND